MKRVTKPTWVWRETAEVLGVVGIIAGIVFLGFELRQNNELMAADARFNQLSIRTDIWAVLADSPELVAYLVKDRNGETLTSEEELRLNSFWMRTLLNLEWQYVELPENIDSWTAGHRRNYESYGSLRRTWEGGGAGSRAAGRHNFNPGFVEFYEQTIVNR